MLEENKRAILNRLKTVRGHLDGIVQMVEVEAYCVDIMKQISAVQASLERANRLVLKNHLETCFSEAVRDGRGDDAVAEIVDAVKFSPALTGPKARVAREATGERNKRSRAGAR
ncbi:MAG: metal-sensitive transcriptional regulator [Actinomycetota bacterium]|jgi:DNA-binding FrmR family transcriptional regulator